MDFSFPLAPTGPGPRLQMAQLVPSRICNQPDVTLQNSGFGVCNVVATYRQGYTSGGMGLDFWTRVHQPHHAQSMKRLVSEISTKSGDRCIPPLPHGVHYEQSKLMSDLSANFCTSCFLEILLIKNMVAGVETVGSPQLVACFSSTSAIPRFSTYLP